MYTPRTLLLCLTALTIGMLLTCFGGMAFPEYEEYAFAIGLALILFGIQYGQYVYERVPGDEMQQWMERGAYGLGCLTRVWGRTVLSVLAAAACAGLVIWLTG